MSSRRTPVAAAPVPGAEIELKLALPAGGGPALLRKLAAVPALARVAPVRQQLHNQYFDTPAQDLRARRAALRLRRVQGAGQGEQWLQTLKTADAELSALSQRGEWETPVPGPALQPKALRAAPPWRRLDPEGTLLAALQPCFATDFERTSWTLRQRGGVVIEVALDQGHIHAGEGSAPIAELELELLAGPPEALFRLAAQIARHVAVLPLSASKAQRGFALAQGLLDAPRRARPPAWGGRPALQDLAAALLGEAFDQFCTNLHGLLAADSAELVHQARVGWRRWRSALRLCAADLGATPPPWQGLEPLLGLLGELRDLDVACTQTLPATQAVYVDGSPVRSAEWEQAVQVFQHAANVQRKAVRLALQEPMTGQALLGMLQWLEGQPHTTLPARLPARRWARQRIERLHARWKKARRDACDGASAHRARLLAKRLRYNIEALLPLLPDAAQRWHAQALQAQDQVGRLRDVQMTAQWAARLQAPQDVVAFLRGHATGWAQALLPTDPQSADPSAV